MIRMLTMIAHTPNATCSSHAWQKCRQVKKSMDDKRCINAQMAPQKPEHTISGRREPVNV